MLFNFLVEIQESKFNGKHCFVVIAAKHSTKNIEQGAVNVGNQNIQDQNYSSIDAVVDFVEKSESNSNAMIGSNVSVYFFDEQSKSDVFYKAMAKACFWLMDNNVNKGLNSALSKLDQLRRLGGNRPYEGFSSFIGTKTNKLSHKVVLETINKMIESEKTRDDILKRILANKDKNDRLVLLDTSSLQNSKNTIDDLIALSLFISPIKTQNMSETVEWVNKHYRAEKEQKKLSWHNDYRDLIVDVGRSICKTVKEANITNDVDNLFTVVDIENSVETMNKLERAVWLCSASELLWQIIVKAENT